MTRFYKIYQAKATTNENTTNRQGYGYIKRRFGLLSNEVKRPTYSPSQHLSESTKNTTQEDR